MAYFQKVAGDPEGKASLDEWTRVKDHLLAGKPRPTLDGSDGRLTVVELCDRFLSRKQDKQQAGEIVLRHFNDYRKTTDRMIRVLGKTALVEELLPDHFARLRKDITKTRGPVSFNNERTRVVSVFKFAWDERLIKTPVDYGTAFDRAPRKLIRQARNEKAARMFEADEIRRLIDGAGVHLRAMILLGCNGGFGNSDCEQLPIEAVDLDGGWVRFPRPKTQVPRAFPLWAKTADALRASLAKRPTPKSEADAHLFFITKYGASWHKATERGPVVLQFRRLLDDLGLHKHGRGFYALRHAFETIGGESKDQVAVDAIMGHIREDVASNYRERISDDRLRAVVDTVQAWLFADMAGDVHRAPAAGDNRPVRLRVVGGQAASVPSTQHGLG
jgi:integrase